MLYLTHPSKVRLDYITTQSTEEVSTHVGFVGLKHFCSSALVLIVTNRGAFILHVLPLSLFNNQFYLLCSGTGLQPLCDFLPFVCFRQGREAHKGQCKRISLLCADLCLYGV